MYEVKKFSRSSVHVIVSNKDFKPGDKVEVIKPGQKRILTEDEVEALIDQKIADAKRGY